MRLYDTPQHRALRKHFRAVVSMGYGVCVRCGQSIEPTEHWDLGHVDGDPMRHAGPEHRRCNRATSRHRVERRLRRTPSLW